MSLTPFIRHELEHQPGTAAAPENSCTRCSPPLGSRPSPCTHPPHAKIPPRCFHTGAGSIIMNYRSTSACNFFSAPLSPVL